MISVFIIVSIQHEGRIRIQEKRRSFVLFRISDPIVMNSELRLALWKTRRIVYFANPSVALALLQL